MRTSCASRRALENAPGLMVSMNHPLSYCSLNTLAYPEIEGFPSAAALMADAFTNLRSRMVFSRVNNDFWIDVYDSMFRIAAADPCHKAQRFDTSPRFTCQRTWLLS